MDKIDLSALKRSVRIEEVIGKYEPLKRSGAEFIGVNHDSLKVNPDKRVWAWFSKGEGGDVFDWFQKEMGMDFADALKAVAEFSTAAPLDYQSSPSRHVQAAPPKPISMRLVERLNSNLLSSKAGMEYIFSRGLDEKDVSKYQLGFISDLRSRDKNGDELLVGPVITIPYIQSGIVQTIRYRVMAQGVNYANKYKPLYTGYGVHLYIPVSHTSLLDGDKYVLIVEGEFKAIHLDRSGVNAVGIPGVGVMKEEWFDFFKKKKTVYIALDPDKSAYELRWPFALASVHPNVRIVNLPMKPDDLILAEGGLDALRSCVAASRRITLTDEEKKEFEYIGRSQK
jgi:DNA primase